MQEQPNSNAPEAKIVTLGEQLKSPTSVPSFAILGVGIAIVAGFYFLLIVYTLPAKTSTFAWWWSACNDRNDYEHGRFVPFAILALIFIHRKKLLGAEIRPSWVGIVFVIIGCLLFVASVRTVQGRIAIGALPFLILGGSLYLWGPKVTKILFFPVCLIYFAIPLPGLNQATNNLQIFATQTAYHVSSLFGVDVVRSGTEINSATSSWGFDIAGGCSGIRSLVALTLIAAIYGHLTQNKLWKKIVLFASSVPLALIANGLRVTTIILIAEYGSPEFAGATYHNFSGFLFFPLGLLGLMLVNLALNRKLPFLSSTGVKHTVVTRENEPSQN